MKGSDDSLTDYNNLVHHDLKSKFVFLGDCIICASAFIFFKLTRYFDDTSIKVIRNNKI